MSVNHSLYSQVAILHELFARCLEKHLDGHGVSLATFQLLAAVHAAEGRSHQAQIAKYLGVSPPTLSEAIRLATAKGLVRQAADSGDGRLKFVLLTEAGNNVLARGRLHLDAVNQVITSTLSQAEIDQAVASISAAVSALETWLTTIESVEDSVKR